ncbi:MAG: S-layer homology domain-containing protein [Oscillospiraceae bacterium]|nr:S-layer homology domain-containing protein [Oscillospiraceae bacterium]
MRNTRKWLVLLLTVVMLVNTLGITAMAAEDESPIALAVAAGSGSVTQVQVLATEAQTVADGKLVLTYDAEALTWLSAEPGAAWGENDFFAWSHNPNEGKLILTFASAEAAAEGVLFTVTFEGIADSTVAIEGSYISGVDAELDQEILTCPSARFTDLDGLYPTAHKAIDFMAAHGYMAGMTQTTFGPGVTLNRAMMVTILYRAAGSPEVTGAPVFTDVPADSYCADAVAWAYETKITSGVSKHLFAPTRELTRMELVTFLYAFARAQGMDLTASADLSAYTDADKIQPFALKPFQWAVANGIISGTSATTLDPEATTNRLQVCLMVYRMLSIQE